MYSILSTVKKKNNFEKWQNFSLMVDRMTLNEGAQPAM
jgi:hypothetical protein